MLWANRFHRVAASAGHAAVPFRLSLVARGVAAVLRGPEARSPIALGGRLGLSQARCLLVSCRDKGGVFY